jgi:hypothetical protein
MTISRLSQSNTFAEWLTTTDAVVANVNALTDNVGGGFIANSAIFIQGVDPVTGAPTATLNVRTHANINSLQSNTANITQLAVGGNVSVANVTNNLYVGKDAFIYGNLTISGNVTLDSLGFDDLSVAGSVNSTNLNTSTANITQLVGSSNTAIYSTIDGAIGQAIAFSIALG